MHREEARDIESCGHLGSSGEIIASDAGIDRKETAIDVGARSRTLRRIYVLTDVAQTCAEVSHGLAYFLRRTLVGPYPGVEIAGMKQAYSDTVCYI